MELVSVALQTLANDGALMLFSYTPITNFLFRRCVLSGEISSSGTMTQNKMKRFTRHTVPLEMQVLLYLIPLTVTVSTHTTKYVLLPHSGFSSLLLNGYNA